MKICRWSEFYETHESRKYKNLTWLALPNSHGGEKYAEIFEHPEGTIIFACWILMLQVASKSNPRGFLIRDDGTPHNPLSLFRKTRCPVKHFDVAIPFLVQIGWIELLPEDSAGVAAESGEPPSLHNITEQNRRPLRKKSKMKGSHIEALATVGRVVLDRNSIKEEF